MPTNIRYDIPGVGTMRAGFDRVRIVSSRPVAVLKNNLPRQALEEAGHHFEITSYTGQNPGLRSVLTIICAGDDTPLRILSNHKALLGEHAVTAVEIALDSEGGNALSATESLLKLVGQLKKPRQKRRHLQVEHQPDRAPPPGCLAEPTYYFEGGKSTVKLKVYARKRKLARRGYGELHARLEWTLTGKRAITSHVGGNAIEYLLSADLVSFIEQNLRLEQVDLVTLGNVLRRVPANRRPKKRDNALRKDRMTLREQWKDPDYRARLAALVTLRMLAYRELELGHYPDFEHAKAACQSSPALIRGFRRITASTRGVRRRRRRARR
jgi:hypothetical protein